MFRGAVFVLVLTVTAVNSGGPGATEFFSDSPVVAAGTVIASGSTAVAGNPATRPEEEAAPIDYWSMMFVLVLSTFVGLGVIGRVSRLLHTPLMSLTNAISAIAVVGSIMVTGSDYPTPIRILGAVALFASMANIVSGFLITDRMLKMFKQVRPPQPAAPSEQPIVH